VAETLEELRITVEGDCWIDQRTEIEIRFHAAFANHVGASREQGRLCSVSANRGDDREPVERLMERNA
jgi:hypothetical protein